MGCDIHFYVEKRNSEGKWESADAWTIQKDTTTERGVRKFVQYTEALCHSRNYNLFAILANVRNGVGFADCDTGDGFQPIDRPRGLPEDVSIDVREMSDSWGSDGHSHSYLTVDELLKYDWTQVTQERGYVTGPIYWKWQQNLSYQTTPDAWCGGVGGGTITREDMDSRITNLISTAELGNTSLSYWDKAKLIEEKLGSVYCQVSWEISYARCCVEFWWSTMPKLLQLGSPEDVRIVFWFDN